MAETKNKESGQPSETPMKPGYKLTKIGWIPEDWELLELAQVADISGGYAFKSDLMLSEKSEFQILKMSNVYQGILDLERSPSYWNNPTDNEKEYLLKKADIVLTLTGTVGKRDFGFATRIENEKNLLLNQRICRLVAQKKCHSLYLFYTLRSDRFLYYFFLSSRGGTGNQANVSTNDIKQIPIHFPSLPEQQKIAQILSAWDMSITKTEQLIAKKQQRKKGLMQQLLTGKKRFREFVKSDKMKETKLGWIPEDWVVIELGKKGNVISGLTYSPDDVKDSGTLVLRSSNVQKDRLAFDNNVFVDSSKYSFNPVVEGDVLICVRNGSRDLIGKNTLITKEVEGVAFGAFMTVFRSHDYKYFIQLFKTNFWNREINKNLGATINSINGSNLKKFRFPFPKDMKEVVKIASVLSSADQEISSLQNQLAKLKEQKKGLMQKLLTGEVRVKI